MGIEMSSARRDRPAVEKPGETEEMRAEIVRLKAEIAGLHEELAAATVTIGHREAEIDALHKAVATLKHDMAKRAVADNPQALRDTIAQQRSRIEEQDRRIASLTSRMVMAELAANPLDLYAAIATLARRLEALAVGKEVAA